MAEDIHIPSPSVFLRDSPSPPRARDDQPPVAKSARKQSSTTPKTKKAPTRKQSTAASASASASASTDAAPKPKQSKSRNGISFRAFLRPLQQSLMIYAKAGKLNTY
jgi:hypothetical protein